MDVQTIVSPSGETLVVLSKADYVRLVEAAEEATDAADHQSFRRRLAASDEELLPAAMVDRLLGGENPIRVWREHRQLTTAKLAEMAGIARPFLAQLETGKRDGTVDTLRRLAQALGITIDDLVG